MGQPPLWVAREEMEPSGRRVLQPPAHPCRETSLGKSSSGFPLLLHRAERVSQEVTTEEFGSWDECQKDNRSDQTEDAGRPD